MSDKKIKVGVVGGTGYTGVELLRLLGTHPGVRLECITSRKEAGRDVSELFPNLRELGLRFSLPEVSTLKACDVVFFATPNGTAMTMTRELLSNGVRVIDLAADFRLKSVKQWEQWYKLEHACPELLEEAVYGLPEINRDKIVGSRLVANPGCYPTSVQLGFLPLLESQLMEPVNLIADTKSGVSGAGRSATLNNLFCEAAENFKAYAVTGHRHLPEIAQGLTSIYGGEVHLTFVPHLTPMIRGIHATLYGIVQDGSANLQEIYEKRYENEFFVDVLPAGTHPETRSVKGSNFCRIAVHRAPDSEIVVILSVIDNLTKGAAGQAVQNMNIMFGMEESLGLTHIALLP